MFSTYLLFKTHQILGIWYNLDVEKAIQTKREIRKYDQSKDVSEQDIITILEAGRLGQSSKNRQPVRFIVIKDKGKLEQLSKCTYSGDFLPYASFGVAVITEDAKLPEIDSARAVQNMMLVAWNLGITSCWITNFWEKGLNLLGVPMNGRYRLITVIPFGYPHPDVIKPKGKRIRKPFHEVVFKESFDQPWKLE